MNIARDAMTKAVGQKREKCWDVEDEHDTDMGATGAERLESGIP